MSKAVAAARGIGLLAITLIVFLLHLPSAGDQILFEDSADYMRAAQAPLLSTWLNTDSASPVQLLHLRHRDPEFRQRPWDYLYAIGDNAALRHFHGPVSFYAMHVARRVGGSDRSAMVLAAGVAALACGFLFLFLAQFGVPLVPAALLALLAGLQGPYFDVSVPPSPHGCFILFALCFLYFFARFVQSRRPLDLFLAAAVLALASATLEFTIALFASIPVALVLLWIADHQRLPRWSGVRLPLLKAIGIFLATTFIVWPGGWLRGGYAESYGVLSATVLFKNKTAFGEHLTAGLIYRTVFAHHPVLLLLALFWVIAAVWLFLKHRLSTPAIIFSTYALFAFLLGVADHFRLNTYISEFVVFLIAAAALVGNDVAIAARASYFRSLWLRRGMVAAISVGLALGCVSEWIHGDHTWASPWLGPVFTGVQQHVPAGQTLLVTDNREALSLYLPQYRFEPTLNGSSAQPRSATRGANARYCLFDSSVPLPPNARVLADYPSLPGHSEVLCELP